MFIFYILLSLSAFSKDTWIQVVGVDETTKSQNYDNFYQSAFDFNETCKTLNKNCTSFIDTNTANASTLRSEYLADRLQRDYSVTKPSKKNVLEQIKNSLLKAQTGEKVLISLENHGGPGTFLDDINEGKSCVYVNSKECISEQDLKVLFEEVKIPKGVKVGIVADACYSGAFNDLMNENVCVASTADQYYVGTSKPNPLWETIKNKKGFRFADMSQLSLHDKPIFNLSQDVYTERSCIQLRENLKKYGTKDKNVFDLLLYKIESSNRSINKRCENRRMSLDNIADLNFEIARIDKIRKAQNIEIACKDPTLSEVCQLIDSTIEDLKSSAKHLDTLRDKKNLEQRNEELQDFFKKMSDLATPEERRWANYLYAPVLYSSAPESSKISATQKAKIKALVEDGRGKYKSFLKAEQKLSTVFSKDKKTEDVFNKIEKLARCLKENEPGVQETENIKEFNLLARVNHKKTFTKEDIERAKKCENNFVF